MVWQGHGLGDSCENPYTLQTLYQIKLKKNNIFFIGNYGKCNITAKMDEQKKWALNSSNESIKQNFWFI